MLTPWLRSLGSDRGVASGSRRPGGRRRTHPRHAGMDDLSSWPRSGLLGGLDLELEADLVAHHDAAALERGVPGDAEVLAVDLGGGREAGPPAARRVGRRTVVLRVERDGAGGAREAPTPPGP